MKSFLCILAVVAAVYADAEPEAQYYGYALNNYAASPYVYNRPAVYNSLGYNTWGYNGFRTFGKREAEADADAQYYVNPISAYSGISAYSAYSPLTASYVRPVSTYAASTYYNPSVYNYGAIPAVHALGKREAEAEPEADAQYYVNPVSTYAGYAAYQPYAANYVRPVSTYASSVVAPSVYNYGIPAIRAFGKREAEADAQYYTPYMNNYAYNAYRPYTTYNTAAYNPYYRPAAYYF